MKFKRPHSLFKLSRRIRIQTHICLAPNPGGTQGMGRQGDRATLSGDLQPEDLVVCDWPECVTVPLVQAGHSFREHEPGADSQVTITRSSSWHFLQQQQEPRWAVELTALTHQKPPGPAKPRSPQRSRAGLLAWRQPCGPAKPQASRRSPGSCRLGPLLISSTLCPQIPLALRTISSPDLATAEGSGLSHWGTERG